MERAAYDAAEGKLAVPMPRAVYAEHTADMLADTDVDDGAVSALLYGTEEDVLAGREDAAELDGMLDVLGELRGGIDGSATVMVHDEPYDPFDAGLEAGPPTARFRYDAGDGTATLHAPADGPLDLEEVTARWFPGVRQLARTETKRGPDTVVAEPYPRSYATARTAEMARDLTREAIITYYNDIPDDPFLLSWALLDETNEIRRMPDTVDDELTENRDRYNGISVRLPGVRVGELVVAHEDDRLAVSTTGDDLPVSDVVADYLPELHR